MRKGRKGRRKKDRRREERRMKCHTSNTRKHGLAERTLNTEANIIVTAA